MGDSKHPSDQHHPNKETGDANAGQGDKFTGLGKELSAKGTYHPDHLKIIHNAENGTKPAALPKLSLTDNSAQGRNKNSGQSDYLQKDSDSFTLVDRPPSRGGIIWELFKNQLKGAQGGISKIVEDYIRHSKPEDVVLPQKTVPSLPKTGADYANRALERLKTNVPGAETDINTAIALDPHCAQAYQGRATLRMTAGNLQGAIDDLKEAIRLAPNNPRLDCKLAGAYASSNDNDPGLAQLNDAALAKLNDAATKYGQQGDHSTADSITRVTGYIKQNEGRLDPDKTKQMINNLLHNLDY